MKKPKIAIASVLKPLNDARSFHRLGISLRETNKYHLNFIGFSTKNVPNKEFMDFFILFDRERSNFRRVFVSIKFISIIQKIKPQVLIVATYELIIAAILLKPLLHFRLVYDLQENYVLNIKNNKSTSSWKSSIAIQLIKFIEKISKPFIDKYIFAEDCYKEEFPEIDNYIILENKFHGVIENVKSTSFFPDQALNFLISGTLTEVYGIVEAMRWFGELIKFNPNHKLIIIGHVTMIEYGKKIENIAFDIPQISLDISSFPVEYGEILSAYKQCDIVLLPYQQVPSISPKIPSKLFESLALGKPFLHSPNQKWDKLSEKYQSGIAVDFLDLTAVEVVLKKIYERSFYSEKMDSFPYWNSLENKKFLGMIDNILK